MQQLSNRLSSRRTVYSILIGVILLTIPCYVIGIAALLIAQPGQADRSTTTPTATLLAPLLQTFTPLPPTPTFGEIPTQFVPPTVTPRPSDTPTPPPTATPEPPPTYTPSPSPTVTLPPTVTDTPTPEPTETPTEAPTETPTPIP